MVPASGSQVSEEHVALGGGCPHAARMDSTAGAADLGRGSVQEGDPSQPPELEEQGLEAAAEAVEHPTVEQRDHEQTQADKPGDVRLEVWGHCPGLAHQQMFVHSARVEGEP